MKIGFVVNRVATEEPGYTTTRLAMAATRMGHEVWLMGVDDFAHDPDTDVFMTGTGPVLLFVGRIQPLKGLDVAVRALAALRRPDARLVVVPLRLHEVAVARAPDRPAVGGQAQRRHRHRLASEVAEQHRVVVVELAQPERPAGARRSTGAVPCPDRRPGTAPVPRPELF